VTGHRGRENRQVGWVAPPETEPLTATEPEPVLDTEPETTTEEKE
jgi:hypothetical protein